MRNRLQARSGLMAHPPGTINQLSTTLPDCIIRRVWRMVRAILKDGAEEPYDFFTAAEGTELEEI